VGLSRTAIFTVFADYFFGYFSNEASVIIWRYAVRSVFAPVLLAENVRIRKIIA